ncbi:MAG: hypothetical protein AAGH89_12935 [Verrucomicrobiota bacterium]
MMVLFSTEAPEFEATASSLSQDDAADGVVLYSDVVSEREEIRDDSDASRQVLKTDPSRVPGRFRLFSAPEEIAEAVRRAKKALANRFSRFLTSVAMHFDFLTSYLRLFGGPSPPSADADPHFQNTRPIWGRVTTRQSIICRTLGFDRSERVVLRTVKSTKTTLSPFLRPRIPFLTQTLHALA